MLLGELGLAGEARPVSQAAVRVREAASMGFRRCVLPAGNLPVAGVPAGVEFVPLESVADLAAAVFELA